MSGYRAAPEESTVKLTTRIHGERVEVFFESNGRGAWGADIAGDIDDIDSTFDDALTALYWSRQSALDSAAAACEAIGDARGAEAVRRLKGTT